MLYVTAYLGVLLRHALARYALASAKITSLA